MSAITPAPLQDLRIEPAAEWFGRRLCGLMAGMASEAVEPIAWCLHQWMQGHSCLDLDGLVQAPPREEGSKIGRAHV